jgi:NADH-quinone oxidoreductase subunit N
LPAINWTEAVNPNYLYLLPEIIVVATMLVVMIVDFYVKDKKTVAWASVGGLAMAMVFVGKGWLDHGGMPQDYFGRMVVADGFSFFLRAVLLLIAALITMLSIDYVEKFLKGAFLEVFEVILATTLGMMFMVGSRELLAIYLGLELTSISSYVLAGLLRKDPKSNEAALKYFLNGTVASAVLLFGISLLYGATGTTYLPEMAQRFAGLDAGMTTFLVVGMLFVAGGFAFKISAAPMHLWAPDTYEGAPTPITGFFSVGPKGAAVGAIMRIFLIGFGTTELAKEWTLVWAVLATASMFLGNITALVQTNIKRMMAYSSIAQAGYILVGVVAAGGTLTSGKGVGAVLYYVLAYALTNLCIFAVLTHMDQEGGWVTIEDFKGLAQRNPLYAWSLLVAFISLIGIPPTAGFMGKFFLFRAALESQYLWLALAMAVNSAISVGYYYGVVKAMFLEKSDRAPLQASAGVLVTVVISLAGVILVGIFANPFLEATMSAATTLIK